MSWPFCAARLRPKRRDFLSLASERYAELTELNTSQEKRQALLASLQERIANEGKGNRQAGRAGKRSGATDRLN